MSFATMFRHMGGPGLFAMAVLDGSPLPTFAGPDILTAIFAARHIEPWYFYAAVATAGAVLGAFLTYRAARAAGADYLKKKFGKRKLDTALARFDRWGTAGLAVSSAIPFPFPTSALFAAAGVVKYPARRLLAVVAICRGTRYTLIAWIAFRYGRKFIHRLNHAGQFFGWFAGITIALVGIVALAFLIRKRPASAQ